MDKKTEKQIVQAVRDATKKPKQPLEFSKKLALVVTGLFFLTWVVAWFSWFTKGELPSELLEFITIPFCTVITGYFAKSGFENNSKIKNSQNEYAE